MGKGVLFFSKKLVKYGRHVGESICVVNPINMTWRQLPDLVLKCIGRECPELDCLRAVSLRAEDEGGFQVFVHHIKVFVPGKARYIGGSTSRSVHLSIYSSMTHSWTRRFVTYKRPEYHVTLYEAVPLVGQEFLYTLDMHPRRNDLLVQVDLFEASSGEPVCSGALMIYPLERYDVGLVQLKEREVMIAVPAHGGTCKILALPDYSSESWDEICLPKDLAMKMAPGGDFDSDYEHDEHCGPYHAGAHQFPFETAPTWVCDVDVAGAFVVLTVSVNHAEHSYVVVYDFLMKTWKIVLGCFSGDKDAQAPYSWDRILERSYHRGIRYLEPRPRLRLGMTDYPQSRQGHVAANVTMSVIPSEVTGVPHTCLLS